MTGVLQAPTELDRLQFYIDGRWVDPVSSETHTAIEAATENS